MKRSTIVRNETVPGEISFVDSFYLLLLPYCRVGISLVKERKAYIRFFGREKFMVSRKKVSLVSLYASR